MTIEQAKEISLLIQQYERVKKEIAELRKIQETPGGLYIVGKSGLCGIEITKQEVKDIIDFRSLHLSGLQNKIEKFLERKK